MLNMKGAWETMKETETNRKWVIQIATSKIEIMKDFERLKNTRERNGMIVVNLFLFIPFPIASKFIDDNVELRILFSTQIAFKLFLIAHSETKLRHC